LYDLLKDATKNTVLSLPYKGTCIPIQVSRPFNEFTALRVFLLSSIFKSTSSLILRRSLSCEESMVALILSGNAVNFVCIAEHIQITLRKSIRSMLESIKLVKVREPPLTCKLSFHYYNTVYQNTSNLLRKSKNISIC
jgi:hypothetical protein